MSEEKNSFIELTRLADEYLKPIGMGEDLVIDLYLEKSDWAFVVQLDATIETISRAVLGGALTFYSADASVSPSGSLSDFTKKLGYSGRTSVLSLLEAMAFPKDQVNFANCVRHLRNRFAHNIQNREFGIYEMWERGGGKAKDLYLLAYASEEFDFATLKTSFQENGHLFRMTMLQAAMVFMFRLNDQFALSD